MPQKLGLTWQNWNNLSSGNAPSSLFLPFEAVPQFANEVN